MQHGEIEVTIHKDGNVTFEVKGVKGKGCEELTKALEKELGTVTRREHKAEYYVKQQEHLRQRGN